MADKSALYPRLTWAECLDFVRTVSSFNLKSVSYTEIARKYGLTSPTAKSFTAKISSAKQFGLITTSDGNVVQLTDTCKRILFPVDEDTRSIERACFSLPPLYSKLIAAYDGKALPNQTLLSNVLMNSYRIQRGAKDVAADAFLKSAEQLDLIRGGILCYSQAEELPKQAQELEAETGVSDDETQGLQAPVESGIVASTPIIQTSSSLASGISEADYITQAIPVNSGKIARFIIPVDSTQDDLLLLRDMFDVLLKRKFKIDIE